MRTEYTDNHLWKYRNETYYFVYRPKLKKKNLYNNKIKYKETKTFKIFIIFISTARNTNMSGMGEQDS